MGLHLLFGGLFPPRLERLSDLAAISEMVTASACCFTPIGTLPLTRPAKWP